MTLTLVILYEYTSDKNYFDKVLSMRDKLQKIEVYKKSDKAFWDFKNYFDDLCDEICDISHVVETTLKSIGYFEDGDRMRNISISTIEECYNENYDTLIGFFNNKTSCFNEENHVMLSDIIITNEE